MITEIHIYWRMINSKLIMHSSLQKNYLFTEHQGLSSASGFCELCKNYPRHARLKSFLIASSQTLNDIERRVEKKAHLYYHPKYALQRHQYHSQRTLFCCCSDSIPLSKQMIQNTFKQMLQNTLK